MLIFYLTLNMEILIVLLELQVENGTMEMMINGEQLSQLSLNIAEEADLVILTEGILMEMVQG